MMNRGEKREKLPLRLNHSKELARLMMIQGIYYGLTGLWPLLHMSSFIKITGPKSDLWLVQTVGMIILFVGCGFIVAGARKSVNVPLIIIALGLILGFIVIEIVYVFLGVISVIYMADALVQAALLFFWILFSWRAIVSSPKPETAGATSAEKSPM